jgi:predicted membrane-bound spermidine synthase
VAAGLVAPVFFLSGFAALLYQIVWQRALFTLYGTSTESVTLVVTSFMLGLGLGSLAGGAVSRSPRVPLLAAFGLAELAIGAFGFVSLPLFREVGAWTSSLAGPAVGLAAFALVLVPTLLMGGTLPLLVADAVRRSGNVGRSVGMLYFVNTLGAAAGAFAAGLLLLGALGEVGSVRLAAGVNAGIGAAVLAAGRLR